MSSQTLSGKTNYNTDPYHIYYDLQIQNNDTSGINESIPVRFEETRNSTILANPSQYFLSIVRFFVDTPVLPLIVPQVETNPALNPMSDPALTIYDFCIVPTDGSVPTPVIGHVYYQSTDTTLTPPAVNKNSISDPYYYTYQYQDFIDMINNSIAQYVRINYPTIPPPFLAIDSITNLLRWYLPQNNANPWTYGPAVPTKKTYEIYVNSPFFALLSSFQFQYVNQIPGVNEFGWYKLIINPSENATIATSNFNSIAGMLGLEYVPLTVFTKLNTSVYGNAPVAPITTTTDNFQVIQQKYPSTPAWSPITSLVFTTALMPINNELIGKPVIVNSNPLLDSDLPNNNFSAVLTDLEVQLTRGDEYKPNVYYSPTAEYRLIDLQSNSPINSIQISIAWKDVYGVSHPLLLEPGTGASMKIMFRRKDFNTAGLVEYTKPVSGK